MAVGSLVSVEEYLHTTYRPDCDYVDGEVLERNMGEQSHGRLQLNIAFWLKNQEGRFRFRGLTEVRLQVRADRFRIPDLMLIPVEASGEAVVFTPPLLCIEILSPGDSLTRMWDRVGEYLEMGVPVCWIIDPVRKRAWAVSPGGHMAEAIDGVLRAGQIEMPLSEVFE